jgi:hypothetical protein
MRLCEDNIKLDSEEIVSQIHVAQASVQSCAAANMAINFHTNIMFLDIIHHLVFI